MRVWRAAPDEAATVAALLAGFRDHLGYDFPSDDSLLRSVERSSVRDDAEYRLGGAPRRAARASAGALVEAVIARASERGCRRVELDVNSENPPALALYRSLGFDTGETGGKDVLMRLRL